MYLKTKSLLVALFLLPLVFYIAFVGITSASQLLNTISLDNLSPIVIAVDDNHKRAYLTTAPPDNSVVVIDTKNNRIIENVPIGTNLVGIDVNPKNHMVYVANYDESKLTIIKGGSNKIINTISGFDHPVAVAVNTITGLVYVTNDKDGRTNSSVSVFDPNMGNIIATIPVGVAPHGIAVNELTNKIYVTNSGGLTGGMFVIDGNTNTIEAEIFGPGPTAVGVGIDKTFNRIYFANNFDTTIGYVDGNTNSYQGTIQIGANRPLGLIVDSVNHRVYVANQGDISGQSVVSVVDSSQNVFLQNVAVGNKAFPQFLGLDNFHGKVFVTLTEAKSVAVISTP